MAKILPTVLTSTLLLSSLYAAQETTEQRERIPSVRKAVDSIANMEQKDIDIVSSFRHMFEDGKVSGQVRSIYANYNNKKLNEPNTYATAIGGILKYELAEFQGFNAGVAFYTSQDINFATGSASEHKQNNELSSSDGSYTDLSEAYINYRYKDLNLRAGRQTLDTPLADSDDIRMIQNTFEAYIASYSYANIDILGGFISSWEGVDQDLDDGWKKVADNGAYLVGASYNELFELNAYYYNFTKRFQAVYLDAGFNYPLNDTISFHGALQFLDESELDNSNYDSTIYGAVAELVMYDLGINIAYNNAHNSKNKQSFSGTGGGSLFTSMDTTIIDEVTEDRDSYAVVGGLSYDFSDFNFLYAYGSFKGDANSNGEKAHLIEQDMGVEYSPNDAFTLAAIYVISEDKEQNLKTEYDWTRMQLMLNYSF